MGLPLSKTSGSAMLDEAPPSPADKIFSKPAPPGADTQSLMGTSIEDEDQGQGGGALADPANRLILSCSMFMQAANLAESVTPGIIPDPIKQWIAQFMEQAPLAAEQLSRQGDPLAMLASAGQAGLAGSGMGAGTAPGAPMGMQAMGMQPPSPTQSPVGAGGGRPMPFRKPPSVNPADQGQQY